MQLKQLAITNRIAIAALFTAAICSGIMFRYNRIIATVGMVIAFSLVVIGIIRLQRNFHRLREQVETVNGILDRHNGTDSDSISSFPLPFAVCNRNAEILWYNGLFDDKLIHECGFSASDFCDYLSVASVFDEKNFTPLQADINGHLFTVYPSLTEDGNCVLYFTDDTVLKLFRQAYLVSRPVVIMITVDSLENTEDTYSHIDYSAINADIDRMISSWLERYGCVFRRYSDGRYIALTEYENFDKMTEKRFDLLDFVRSYRFEGQDPDITLSVGIGREANARECEISARQALDMARGRGGDQVAIKVGENYDFFGGLTGKKEKRGKVKSRSVAAALSELIEKSDRVLIMGHSYSDFDCVGASVGLTALCRSVGVHAHIVVNRATTLALSLIENCEKIGNINLFVTPEKGADLLTDNTLVIITDTMRPALVDMRYLLDNASSVAVIDHHRMTVDHIANPTLLFHEPYASSASEMVTELIQYAPKKPTLTQSESEALLAGIVLDTKNFTLRVGVRTFEAAAFLRERKPDSVRVKKLFSFSAEDNRIVSTVIANAVFENGYAIASTDCEAPNIRLLCSRAADELLNIKDVDSSYVLSKQGNTVMISARSLGAVNVQLIMEALGGGGHQSMAAAQLPDTTPEQAMSKLKEAVNGYFVSNGTKN